MTEESGFFFIETSLLAISLIILSGILAVFYNDSVFYNNCRNQITAEFIAQEELDGMCLSGMAEDKSRIVDKVNFYVKNRIESGDRAGMMRAISEISWPLGQERKSLRLERQVRQYE